MVRILNITLFIIYSARNTRSLGISTMFFVTENSYTADQTKLKTSLNEQTQKRIAAENKILEIRAENERLIKRYRS